MIRQSEAGSLIDVKLLYADVLLVDDTQKKPPQGGFFNEIRPYGRVKSTFGWVKSLCGEIRLRRVMDGFHYEPCE